MMRRALLVLLSCCAPLSAEPPRDGAFVAVGYGGRRMVSKDGVAWEIAAEWKENGGDDSNNLMGLASGKGKFVAVGGAAVGHVLTSTDGKEWKEVHKAKSRVNPVVFGGERFVAGGPDRTLIWSADGETWKDGAKIKADVATHFRHGAFGNGVFVFVGNHGGDSKETWAVVSKDGETIAGENVELPRVRALAFGAGRFVLVGPEGLRISSTDGLKWEHEVKEAGAELWSVAWTGKRFVANGTKGAFSSDDGIAWKAWPKMIPCDISYADESVWIGTSWPGQMWSSKDGLEWTRGPKQTPNGINKVVSGKP